MTYPPNPIPGLPTKITLSPSNVTLARGATVQLAPVLSDAYGTAISPVHPFVFTSHSPALVSVNATGLCTAASGNASELQTGGIAEIEVAYPWAAGSSGAMIHATVSITATVPPGISTSLFLTEDFGPMAQGVTGCWTRIRKLYPSA